MALFDTDAEVYDTVGRLFTEIAADEQLAPRFSQANTTVRYEHSDPDSVITVRLRPGEEPEIEFGPSELEPEVTMTMSAETAHRFWLGRVNVMEALTRGEITADGPVTKILKLVPLARDLFPRYRAILAEQGRSDLIEGAG